MPIGNEALLITISDNLQLKNHSPGNKNRVSLIHKVNTSLYAAVKPDPEYLKLLLFWSTSCDKLSYWFLVITEGLYDIEVGLAWYTGAFLDTAWLSSFGL